MPITIHTARTFVTMGPAMPNAEAVAVDGERIVAVGTLEDGRSTVGEAPHDLDDTFAERVVLPA